MSEQELEHTTVHNYSLQYPKDCDAGRYYLAYRLDAEQVKVFFDQARSHGHADFEDQNGHKFRLTHDSGDGSNVLSLA